MTRTLYDWTLTSQEHPRIKLDGIRDLLDGIGAFASSAGETSVADGQLVEHDARLSVLYDDSRRLLVAVAVDRHGLTSWWTAPVPVLN
jgi:hypothetical protein